MKSRDFVYWLQGYFELTSANLPLSIDQVKVIRNHLSMVFKHEIDPSAGSAEHQAELSDLHSSTTLKPSGSSPLVIKC